MIVTICSRATKAVDQLALPAAASSHLRRGVVVSLRRRETLCAGEATCLSDLDTPRSTLKYRRGFQERKWVDQVALEGCTFEGYKVHGNIVVES